MADGGRPSNHRRKRQKILQTCHLSSHLIPLLCICATVLHFCTVDCSKICSDCDQGRCINDTCVCFPGWKGPLCDECFGRISLPQGKQGVIYDGAANYSKDLTCSWLLDAGQDNMRIQFHINNFATECVWDHLYIHDGDSAFAPLVAAYSVMSTSMKALCDQNICSGIMWGSKGKPHLTFKLSGRYVFIHFYSDAAYTLPGFNISYFVDDCALDCSEFSNCENGTCVCKTGWTGQNCDTMIQGCPMNCSNHGSCNFNQCHCDGDYKGTYCNSSSGDFYVETVENPGSASLTGRASMTLTYDGNDLLWLLGGYMMGQVSMTNNMFRYNISNNTWSQPPEIGQTPWPRYGHSTVLYKDALYVYGGVSGTEVVKDFTMYNITTSSWQELPSGPRNISGHTAHIVNDTMIVIFGYSSDFGYSNKILEFNLVSKNWTILETSGSQVQGGYGHTSVYDRKRDKIYVYGGYHSQSSSSYNLTDKLYEYNPHTKEWFLLHNSGNPRYLHSAAMMNGFMLTFGGNTHNDTRVGRQAKCFASDFMIYDRDCNSWYTLTIAQLNMLGDSLDRFGHASVSVDDVVYIFGGFNSLVIKDLLKVTAGNCSFYKDNSSCVLSVQGIKCQWVNSSCKSYSAGTPTEKDPNAPCSGLNTCSGCHNRENCQWCNNMCYVKSLAHNCSVDTGNCSQDKGNFCNLFHNCKACNDNEECVWQSSTCEAMKATDGKTTRAPKVSCSPKVCSDQHTCDNCTNTNCMWCSNLKQCIDTNSYIVSFHYGQCMDWTTKQLTCQASNCSEFKTCEDCQAMPKCGWCNDETGTGTGMCMEGGMSGPIKQGKPARQCPFERWFFNDCPKCQCNGHSICLNGSDKCEQCKPPTTGPHCQYCMDGFYGNPENGGNCSACSCNGQADTCNPVTGNCYCRTRGVTGKNCDKCDDGNKYSGNPKNGTCYYNLNTDYQYTFNLSKSEDVNYTQINFSNLPHSSDRDVDFTLNCSTFALLNITYKSKSFPEEKVYASSRECSYFRTKFEYKNHAFGGKENTTFLVYVYDFNTPFMLQISFVQPDKINLLKFFIIFFSCFLSLLLIAAALWKIKHKYDSYRRRQQLIVEMQQMASRPFSTICVEMDRKGDPAVVDKKDHLDAVLRRRKKTGNKPSSIAIEPLADHKAAILTLIIQLPTGDLDYAPAGQSGLAVGSALVSMGSNRKQSLEHIKGDRTKIRKNMNFNHPDACA